MTLTEALAARMRVEPGPAEGDSLRTLTLCNLAAAAGELGRVADLLGAIHMDPNRGAPEAAFVNAMALHARTQDDFYPAGRVHVGAVTLAVALALRDEVGDRLLRALAAGYEVLCLASAAYSASAQSRGLRPTGVFGPLGAAATAAVALDLDDQQAADAIGFAATLAGGTNAAWAAGSDEWVFEAGAAARLGIEAALFARAGVRAAPDAIEGSAGWAEAFFDDPGAAKLEAELTVPGSRIGGVAIKPYPVSGIAQVPTWLGEVAHREHADRGVEEATIRISPAEASYPGTVNRGPFRSRSDALMSVAFCVACARRFGGVSLAQLESPNEPELLAACGAVRLQPDESLAENEAVLELADGHALRGSGAELLFPGWEQIEPEAIARRSEAPGTVVADFHVELGRERPDAARLAVLGLAEVGNG